MITKTKLKIYQKYDGDVDGWARVSLHKKNLEIEDDDWYLIKELVSGIRLIKTVKVADSFKNQIEEKLLQGCEDEEVINILRKMAEQ